MHSVSNDEIFEEFETFSITITDKNVFNQLRGFCDTYNLNAESLVEHWLAFSTQRKLKISQETLEVFERDRLIKHERTNLTKTPTGVKKSKINNLISNYNKKGNESISVLCSYDDSAHSKKRHLSTPDNESKKRITSITENPMFSLTPACSTPSEKFQGRNNSGEVVLMLGPDVQNKRVSVEKLEICLFEFRQNICADKYMFQRLMDRVSVLSDKVMELGEELMNKENLDHTVENNSHIQNSSIVGRVRPDIDQKLTPINVFLDNPGLKSLIRLDVKDLPFFSLFSGQVIYAEGTNTSGKHFHAMKILEGLPTEALNSNVIEENLNILVACGPFSTSDNLLYEPMGELLNRIQQEKPNLCILCGPFIDQKQVENDEYLDTDLALIFEGLMHDVMQVSERNGVKLVIQPSQRDFLHDYVYPQPPFHIPNVSDNIKLMSDPCTILINKKLCIGVTSTDILLHMSADEIALGNHPTDRISRLIQHLISQKSYYPLQPASPEVNMDYELLEVVGQMPTTPHILILPSDLRFFIKKIDGVLCINPGRLARGQGGGTFANVFLRNAQLTAYIIRI